MDSDGECSSSDFEESDGRIDSFDDFGFLDPPTGGPAKARPRSDDEWMKDFCLTTELWHRSFRLPRSELTFTRTLNLREAGDGVLWIYRLRFTGLGPEEKVKITYGKIEVDLTTKSLKTSALPVYTKMMPWTEVRLSVNSDRPVTLSFHPRAVINHAPTRVKLETYPYRANLGPIALRFDRGCVTQVEPHTGL